MHLDGWRQASGFAVRASPSLGRENVRVPSLSTPSLPTLWRATALPAHMAAAYVFLYLALAWVSFVHPMTGLNITPWNPQSALAVGLLLRRPGAWWLVWFAASCAEGVVAAAPVPWSAALLSSAALTVGYAITARALAHWLGREPDVATRRQFVAFLLVVGAGALVTALLHVLALTAFGIPQPG